LHLKCERLLLQLLSEESNGDCGMEQSGSSSGS
jgi:hypothetical protein